MNRCSLAEDASRATRLVVTVLEGMKRGRVARGPSPQRTVPTEPLIRSNSQRTAGRIP